MKKSLKGFFQLFYPNLCVCCQLELFNNEQILCSTCRHDLPIICYKDFKKNKITNVFAGKIPLEMAISFLYFHKDGKSQQLIHHLKYKDRQEIGSFIGEWFGSQLKASNQLDTIDCIVPVPLHPKKRKQRGYNQLTKFGLALEKQLNIPYTPDILIRTSSRKTQTFKERFERFENTHTIFKLKNTTSFKNKHVLLIDDVLTTGATLESCCKALLKSENIKISIATIAFTE
ncbi:amidophosphoribosyltransferase [Polaribacter pacificus]|uniref:Amidophosphoribosyltransferase n=1 Tax=Polaribacter pacificus TaxID=1775173 RepID=A0A917HVS5_9FLAO|nr:phosphoribosyltransferase family protein [Polaribacter pacificus]GGG91459.1 amidophosphoribosyltransferase [Polaribacter pacificus]